MEFREDRVYSEYHLWVKMEDDRASVGITDFAKEELGSVDYVELPDVDERLFKGKPFGVIETSKAVTDLIAPISGTVIERNDSLSESPQTVSSDPFGSGWLVVVAPSENDEVKDLMSAKNYERLVKMQAED